MPCWPMSARWAATAADRGCTIGEAHGVQHAGNVPARAGRRREVQSSANDHLTRHAPPPTLARCDCRSLAVTEIGDRGSESGVGKNAPSG